MSYQENKLMNLKDGQLLLKTLDGRKADVITETASGEIATFSDGADNLPMEVEVAINPVQDLHGYDNPWPGGGGKNIAPPISSQTFTDYGMTLVVHDDGHVTVSGPTYTRDVFTPRTVCSMTLPAGSYIFNGQNGVDSANKKLTLQLFNVTTDTQIINRDTAEDYSFTLSEPQRIDIRVGYRVGLVLSSPVNMYPMIRLSTVSDATWQPYANICPISGFDGVNIIKAEQYISENEIIHGSFIDGSGNVYPSEKWMYTPEYIEVEPDTTYCLTYDKKINWGDYYIATACLYNSSKTFITRLTPPSTDQTTGIKEFSFTTTSATKYIRISVNNDGEKVVLSKGSTNKISISWQSTAGTVYGGTLTVNKDGSGELIVTHANIASYNGETLPGEWISDRDVYASGTTPTTGAQVVYELATPVTPYTLTAEQIKTLFGINNVYADTGDILGIEYPVDTKAYVDEKTANPLPAVTSDDNGKVLRVVDGEWEASALQTGRGVAF